MITIEEALALCAEGLTPLAAERLPLAHALNRVLAEPARAQLDLPPFDQSAMDGYALASEGVSGASDGAPVRLGLSGEVAAARQAEYPRLADGTSMRIFTGGVVPSGADAVVKQEDVYVEDGRLVVSAPVTTGNNVRRRGEELAAGAELTAAGRRITPGMIGALAVAGVDDVPVHREPRIAVLVTGDEVSPAGADLPLGAIYDGNGPMLMALLEHWGYGDVELAYVEDDRGALEQAMDDVFAEADLVVTTGGVSVGDKDMVIPVAREMGIEEVFWRVRQKPGKPLFLGRAEDGPVLLGLPGNPGAVAVGAQIYLRRLLDVLEGVAEPGPHLYQGRLALETEADPGRDSWLRAVWWTGRDGGIQLEPLGRQASHMLSNLCHANALLRLPASAEAYPAGSAVRWLPL
ncbi:molybdopterin molybdotransferase MoeA [Ectothiorhodospiraceae bacterium WFHF3C12]|nr:molybdopterin molybdotransferase MoeA [Ectothiorhodospiraceae bacterium WFHF3C12]